MLKLRKFKEKKLKNNSLLVSTIILLGLMSSVVISKTYAIYKVEKKYDLIQAKIGDFRGKNQVISYYINNQESDVIPENKNYKVNVSCENATGVWNESKWELELSNITKYTVTCTVNFKEKYVIKNAKSTNNSIIANYSNIENISSNYYLYGTDKNNLNQKSSDITNLNSDTTYYFKKCYEYNNEEICSDVSSLLTAGKVSNFDYTGGEQTYTTTCNGTYKLETWGAQGGNYSNYIPGYGGYSNGTIYLNKSEAIYIIVGGKGVSTKGGYNGGGFSYYQWSFENDRYFASGGGATHIALQSGLLSTLEKENKNILIVSGGGGASYYSVNDNINNKGGSAGGYIGGNGEQTIMGYGSFGYGGTQISGGYSICDATTCIAWSNGVGNNFAGNGSFGKGGSGVTSSNGGGGGYYGGGPSVHVQSAGGGSGYIGNPLLTNKSMYCYNCQESTEESTKTISTTCANEPPTINCAKQGNGYARITIEECSI